MNKLILIIFGVLIQNLVLSQDFKRQIEENRYLEIKQTKHGVIDSLNLIITPFIYDKIYYKNGRLIVQLQNLKGVINTDNQLIVPIIYKDINSDEKCNRFILCTENNQFGLSDSNGKVIIPIKYKRVSSVENYNYYITKNVNDLNGVYDTNGKNVIPEEYKFYTIYDNKIFATKNNQPFILDIENSINSKKLETDIIFINTYKYHTKGSKPFQIIKKGHKFGVINSNNKIIIPIIYDEIKTAGHWRYFIIMKNNKLGIIDINGKIVKDLIYDSIRPSIMYVVLERKNKKGEVFSYEY